MCKSSQKSIYSSGPAEEPEDTHHADELKNEQGHQEGGPSMKMNISSIGDQGPIDVIHSYS